ncbi:evasin P1243-like [Dermacentor silvarum]|uniref:evasin P1243-like n=1 Tax=Dermacentor silvarum TaxID=543639 RepID=UPI002100ECE0|nr:evasin P1243-like [Dermacentor silvarum]
MLSKATRISSGEPDNVPSEDDYSYGTINYDEFTPIPGAAPPGLHLSSEDYESGEVAELCTAVGLETGRGLLPVGCNQSCTEKGDLFLPNDTLCIEMSSQNVSAIENFSNFSCLLGKCNDGICESCGICTWCFKRPIMNMPV